MESPLRPASSAMEFNGPDATMSRVEGLPPSRRARSSRGWASDRRYNEKRRERQALDPVFAAQESTRKQPYREKYRLKFRATKAALIVLGLAPARFGLNALLPVLHLDRWAVARLTKAKALPCCGSGWTLSQAKLVELAVATSRDERPPHRISVEGVQRFLGQYWLAPSDSWEWMLVLPDVQTALERHRGLFVTRLIKSKTPDLDRTFGLGVLPVWLPTRTRSIPSARKGLPH